MFDINAGLVDGISHERKYGANHDVDTGSVEYVWDGSVEYNYPLANENLYLFSDNSSDTGIEIEVSGLVEEGGLWNLKTVRHNTNGATPVSISDFIRVFRARVVSSTSPVGNIQVSSGTTVPSNITDLRCQISLNQISGLSRNSTQMAMYTVPSGYTAFLFKVYTSVSKNKDAEFDFQIRPYNGAFYSTGLIGVFQQSLQSELGFERVEERSDIRVAVTSENNNTDARASFHMILAKNEALKRYNDAN